jgi:hypothetical protein
MAALGKNSWSSSGFESLALIGPALEKWEGPQVRSGQVAGTHMHAPAHVYTQHLLSRL